MKPAPDLRKRELAAIHIARGQLGMDEATYRDMLWAVARVRSAADLDWAGRKRVLDHLAGCGARIGGKRPERPNEWSFVDARPEHERKQWRYLIVLCRDAGIARGKQRAYAEGIARSMAGLGQEIKKPAPLWSGADLANVVQAMVYRVERIRRREGRA
jgi:phage gp16-like protein